MSTDYDTERRERALSLAREFVSEATDLMEQATLELEPLYEELEAEILAARSLGELDTIEAQLRTHWPRCNLRSQLENQAMRRRSVVAATLAATPVVDQG